MHPAVWPQ